MQTGGDFLRVALMIELQQAVKHFSAGCFGNSEADTLLGFVEIMIEG